MNRYAYTPISGDPIRLSLSGCADWGDLHRRIRETFCSPAFYGENWDAMWDCLTDVFLPETPKHILVEGFAAMPEELQACAQPMREISATCRRNTPGSR